MNEHRSRWAPAWVTAIALLYWEAVTRVLEAPEPWDSPNYLFAYLLALAGCGVVAFLVPHRPWRWAVIVIFAQLPVMLAYSGAGPLILVGILFLAGLTLPAFGVAAASAAVRRRVWPPQG